MALHNTKPKVLVIDDDKTTQVLVSEILEEAGVHVLQALRWWDALIAYLNHHNEIALVLLDIRLPGCNGFDLLEQLKKINAGIPVITMSAISPWELAHRSVATGCKAYISKPFDIDRFFEIVRGYLKV